MQLIRPAARVIRRPLARLARDRRGVAMIELALALPLLFAVGISGVEVANLAITVQRVNQLAMMAADNGGRVRTQMDELDANEIMVGLLFAGRDIKFGENGRVILSSVVANGQTGAKAGFAINWQRCVGTRNVTSAYGAEGYGADSSVMANGVGVASPTGTKWATPVSGSALMVAEVRYTYKPVIAKAFMGNKELSVVQVFPVRERINQTLSNTSQQSPAQRRLCDANHLSAT